MASGPRTTGLTYEDLQRFPEDNLRRELIDGELFVTPSPITRHQKVVGEIFHQLRLYQEKAGGEAYPAPLDVFFDDRNVTEPDVLFVRKENLDRVEERFVRSPPDIVVEVSSPSTRRTDQVRKRELYERFGVPEFWFVDLDADRIEVHRLAQGRYGAPEIFMRGDTLASPLLPGFHAEVAEILGDPAG